jgi:hypothetical protein
LWLWGWPGLCGGCAAFSCCRTPATHFGTTMHAMSGPRQNFLGRPTEAISGLHARWQQRRGGKGGGGEGKGEVCLWVASTCLMRFTLLRLVAPWRCVRRLRLSKVPALVPRNHILTGLQPSCFLSSPFFQSEKEGGSPAPGVCSGGNFLPGGGGSLPRNRQLGHKLPREHWVSWKGGQGFQGHGTDCAQGDGLE